MLADRIYNRIETRLMHVPDCIKIVVVGDGAVGKTSLLMSYCMNAFPTDYVPTVFDSWKCQVEVNNEPYTLELYDTAGQEDYDRLRSLSYKLTDVFILCFDVVSPASLENVTAKWVPELQHYTPNAPILLVGLKIDKREERNSPNLSKRELRIDWLSASEPAITRHHEDIKDLLGSKEVAAYMECSAKTQQGLKDVFDKAIMLATNPSKKRRPVCIIF